MGAYEMDLFDGIHPEASIALGAESFLLPKFALAHEATLLAALEDIINIVPLRIMSTPGGQMMSVKTTSCGTLGWVSDRRGYRYEANDPLSGKPWPVMPHIFADLAQKAAEQAGFYQFRPDACLINRYEISSKMGLHQDKDEQDFSQPIVSVSLGIPATFLFGGLKRSDKVMRVALQHGDVVVWGGADRLRFHGIMPIKPANHPALGESRINLTFRKAGA